jgi:uncharacterized delta-60 repeat protein
MKNGYSRTAAFLLLTLLLCLGQTRPGVHARTETLYAPISELSSIEAFNPDASDLVSDIAIEPNGKILVAGAFTSIGGQLRQSLARLNPDGSIDTGFNPTLVVDGRIFDVTIQANGKILVAGEPDNTGTNYVARLNNDGALDPGFNANSNGVGYAVVAQADGKVLVGGQFTSIGGQPRNFIARLNSDGAADTGFNPEANNVVHTLTAQTNGQILLGGYFTSISGQARNHIARLNADGTLDHSFNPNLKFNTTDEHRIDAIAMQPDGKMLIAGSFTSVDGQARERIARLNSDGTLDSGFNANLSGQISTIALQTDGMILVGRSFTSIGGEPRNHLARLNSNGTADSSFNPFTDESVNALSLQSDGSVLLGGYFTSVCGVSRNHLARLSNPTTATQSLAASIDGTVVNWSRSGASPEIDRVAFEQSVDNGANWTSLGAGARIGATADWQLTGLVLPAGQDFLLRARGFQMMGGFIGGDASVYESVQTVFVPLPPSISEQPVSQTVCPGSPVSFSVTADGTAPLSYQWRRNGVDLTDDSNISGATSASLTISSVSAAEAGSFDVIVTNIRQSVTSVTATLTVNVLTAIIAQPVSQTVCEGNPVTFAVTATGTGLSYQWRKNGVNLTGATAATFTINNPKAANGGNYDVVVTGACGTVVSEVATLTVNTAPKVTQDPNNQSVPAGTIVSFIAAATGTAPLSVQWQVRPKGGAWTNITGATSPTLTITASAALNDNRYRAVFTNLCGSDTSKDARLRVN